MDPAVIEIATRLVEGGPSAVLSGVALYIAWALHKLLTNHVAHLQSGVGEILAELRRHGECLARIETRRRQ